MDVMRPPGLAEAPDPATLRAEIQDWVDAPSLAALVARFAGPALTPGEPGNLDALADWSASHWDFRAGRERNLVDAETVDDEHEAAVLAAARDLGLVDPAPPALEHYDHVLMLGGLVRACVWRPEYAAWLMRNGTRADAVAVITGFRDLNQAELELLPAFGFTGVSREHEVMERSLRHAFAIDALDPVRQSPVGTPPNLREVVKVGRTAAGVPVSMVVAPSSEPQVRRANTPDGYEFWASEVASVQPADRVLMVTSTIYVPFQHVDAVRTLGLPHGCLVDTVGIDPAQVDERGRPQVFRAVNYLQEINSMLRSLRALERALGNEPA